jgi:peptidyl-prolyl cis-trans isomerase A (cyclophilin A)
MGDIDIELFAKEAPETVKNFMDLATGKKAFDDVNTGKKNKRPFYDNLIFHRVIKNFMIQGGCPKGDGTGGPGYKFSDEINAKALGLDKIKAIQPDGNVHRSLLIRNQQDMFRVVLQPLYQQMGIDSKQEFENRKLEVQERIKQLTLKDCYENMGYRYSDALNSHSPVRGTIAMANSGPNTNGSQFFINLIDTPWLTGKHTVFGNVIKGMDVVDRIGAVPVNKGNKPIKDVTILSIRPLNDNKQETKK